METWIITMIIRAKTKQAIEVLVLCKCFVSFASVFQFILINIFQRYISLSKSRWKYKNTNTAIKWIHYHHHVLLFSFTRKWTLFKKKAQTVQFNRIACQDTLRFVYYYICSNSTIRIPLEYHWELLFEWLQCTAMYCTSQVVLISSILLLLLLLTMFPNLYQSVVQRSVPPSSLPPELAYGLAKLKLESRQFNINVGVTFATDDLKELDRFETDYLKFGGLKSSDNLCRNLLPCAWLYVVTKRVIRNTKIKLGIRIELAHQNW